MPHTDTHLSAPVWAQIGRGLCEVNKKKRKRVDKVKEERKGKRNEKKRK